MQFGEKPNLPGLVTLRFCADCDFAFTSPRDAQGYRNYYASVSNDLSQRHGQYRNTRQVEIIADLITTNDVGSVFDLADFFATTFPRSQVLSV